MKLQIRGLRHRQGEFQLVLDVEAVGQTLGIFGRSGSGKTTLLEIVAGLRRPQAGTLTLDNETLVDRKRRVFVSATRRQFGYVPQDLALFPHLSVRGNITYGERMRGKASDLPLAQVVTVLDIRNLLDRPIAALSGGQKQRVAFARALLASPRLLLMDEPLASLDWELKATIIPYLQRMRDEFRIPMIYVSHAPQEIAALCDSVIVLRAGKCLGVEPPSEIFDEATTLVPRPGILD